MAKFAPVSELLNILLTAMIATTTTALVQDAIAQPSPSPQPQTQQPSPQPQIQQSPQTQQQQQQTSSDDPSSKIVSILGFLSLGCAAVWGVTSQLLAKWGAATIDAKTASSEAKTAAIEAEAKSKAAAIEAEAKARAESIEAGHRAKTDALESQQRQINQDLRQDAAINEAYMGQAIKSSDVLMRLLDTSMSNIFQGSRELKELFYLLLPLIERNSADINLSHADTSKQFEKLENDISAMIELKKDIIAALSKVERVDRVERRNGSDRRGVKEG
jgi:hypothetical protein